MDKTTLRIIGKIGLLMVIIGFCMPVSCNLNGFQIAEYASSMGGINSLSIGLYGIFVFSCIGIILLLLLVMKKSFSMGWDWFVLIGSIASTIIVFVKMDGGNTGYGGNVLQFLSVYIRERVPGTQVLINYRNYSKITLSEIPKTNYGG